jgi:flagellar hook protein FlgE
MIGAIQSAVLGMDSASRAMEAVSVNVLRKTLDNQKGIAQQMVNMVVASQVYDANAKVIETSQKLLDIVV